MGTCKFIKKLLNLKDLSVVSFSFKDYGKELHLNVKHYKNGCLCPICFRRGSIIRIRKQARYWKDIPFGRISITYWYYIKEIKCVTHGRIQEHIPWASENSRITYRFEYALLVYAQVMTQKAGSQLLGIPTSTFSDLIHRSVTERRKNHKIRNLRILGADEISYCKGRKFATIIYDLERSKVVWIGMGKGRETIDEFFNEALSNYQKAQIELASCDMSEAYIGGIEHHCPNVTLVLDRFHIVKSLNGAVDDVRKEQWRNANKNERESLKGLRWLLFRHSSTRKKGQTRVLNSLRKGNRRIHRAWILKDEFESFWDYKYKGSAENFLKAWSTTALKSRLEPIRKFVFTLRRHAERILPFITTRLTNAKGEGINRIIKIIKNRASGFRTLNAFKDIIFLCVGDLDIPAQLPNRFRSVQKGGEA